MVWLVAAALGIPGGLIAAHYQAKYDHQELLWGDFSAESLVAWLIAGLLGPAAVVLFGLATVSLVQKRRAVPDEPGEPSKKAIGIRCLCAGVIATVPALSAWLFLASGTPQLQSEPWALLSPDLRVAVSVWLVLTSTLSAAWVRDRAFGVARVLAPAPALACSIGAYAVVCCRDGLLPGPHPLWQF